MTIVTRNPATGAELASYEGLSGSAVEQRLVQAAQAFAAWRRSSLEERTGLLGRVAEVLAQRREQCARLITTEMGKPLGEARAEVDKCALVCRHYAERAPAMLAPETVTTDMARSYVVFDPLGAIFAIMPWNFPFWQVFRFAAPAIVAGNVALLKPAPNVVGCSLAIEDVWRAAGAPAGLFQVLLVGVEQVAGLIADERVRAVTLTGSERAGQAVAAAAAKVLKKCVLELGGSDPFIVLDDADVERVAVRAAAARVVNSGQSCIAAKRFLVAAPIADAFTRALASAMERLVVGDPIAADTQIGPIARADLRDVLHDQVERSVRAGAKLVTGGRPLPGPGFFYAPTVLADVRPGMAAFDEEVFGPVAAVVSFTDEQEAVALANRSRYGLGASIWTKHVERAEALARELECGMVFINELVRSDPRLPFGGVKRSGYGRELSHYGLREFVNVRTIGVGGAAKA